MTAVRGGLTFVIHTIKTKAKNWELVVPLNRKNDGTKHWNF